MAPKKITKNIVIISPIDVIGRDGHRYITADREYIANYVNPKKITDLVTFTNDRGDVTHAYLKESSHLGGKSWKIKE